MRREYKNNIWHLAHFSFHFNRDNPQIKKLYKELQASRREIRSIVKKNIEEECERASYPRSNNNGDAENSEYEQMDVDYDGSSGEEVSVSYLL